VMLEDFSADLRQPEMTLEDAIHRRIALAP
jgi:hypothetical protein